MLLFAGSWGVVAQPAAPPAGAFSRPAETKKSLALDGLLSKKSVTLRDPVPYPIVREADIVWSKRIWRTVDLREKVNLPLFYPTDELMLRRSLVQTLVDAIRNEDIRAFDPDEDDEFTTLLPASELSKRFDAVDKQMSREKLDGSGDTTITIRGKYNWEEVRELLVKEDWFFDKHYSRLMVRVVGICPIRVYKKVLNTKGGDEEEETGDEELQKKPLFWIHYDESRKVLAQAAAYLPNNDASVISFDDIFNERRFSSYITKESNVYNNRSIPSYINNGYDALLESEKVKNHIITWEHDLWEY
ncbi:MAG: gliding motility protein GldN [Prevotellaceae bacterium]|jgi:gliding motility associated protien GldN|nr:gliding motility protein GldN [Prevotellaceae bacterium]